MISVRGLKAGYGGPEVLRGFDLDIPKGSFVGILGPNACGKSTLVKVLSGVLSPTSGKVETAGLDPSAAKPGELARHMAVVPQSSQVFFPFTGREMVEMGRYSHAGRFSALSEADQGAVDRALTLTGSVNLADRLVTELSGGERQRIFFARALAQETEILLLDEATASMDVHRSIDAFDLLRKLNKEGKTVAAVLHDINLAALYCERLVFMKDGLIMADGPAKEVLTAKTLMNVYETPADVSIHPLTGRPHAVFLPRSGQNPSS